MAHTPDISNHSLSKRINLDFFAWAAATLFIGGMAWQALASDVAKLQENQTGQHSRLEGVQKSVHQIEIQLSGVAIKQEALRIRMDEQARKTDEQARKQDEIIKLLREMGSKEKD